MALIDLVKYNGPNSVFAWKFPSEELSTWTQLIVNESQEAVFFKGGRALDVFGPGRHTLDTDNIPLLTALVKIPFGGQSPFSAEVWFVNKAHSLDIKWGTPAPIQVQDPKFGIMVPVRSFGQFGIQVENSAKFLVKLVGTTKQFDQETLTRVFRGLFLTKTKDTLAQYLVKKGISVLEMSAYLDELSSHIQEKTAPFLADYGIKLLNFFVNDVSVPEDDPAVQQLKTALAKKAEMNIIGYDYTQQRSFDVLEGAARNPGGAGAAVMGAGIGLGMGAGMGAAFGQQAAGVAAGVSVAPPGQRIQCPACRAEAPAGTRFCPNCGKPMGAQPGAAQPKADIRCSKCGTPMSADARFCPNCGDPYNPCPKCGQDLMKGAASCPSCGYVLPAPCPKCGQPLDRPGLKFCPSCGQSLAPLPCPKCGTANQPGAKFCLNCGQQL
ncbi:MAG: SPFH domain-containing protein [Deltaproteobacteria bacterium]|nr:SPFH domain-containing protein [Deltaproteobacteria bacterium]